MGLRIEQIGASMARFPLAQEGGLNRRSAPVSPFFPEEDGKGANFPLLGRDERQVQTAGFGEGTVSLPGVAVETLDRNFLGIRRLLPSLEEAREDVQQRLEEQRDLFGGTPFGARSFTAATEREESREPLSVTLGQGQALARNRARDYIGALNEGAAAAAARFGSGQEAETQEGGPAVRIGSETARYEGGAASPSINIFA